MKKLSELKQGVRFVYGGIDWVKLDTIGAGALCLSADSAFDRAFDDDNKNDWRSASLRRELNGPFLDTLVQEGADRAAFLTWGSDLTADDGMTDYVGDAVQDKIALLSCDLYREYRAVIPKIGCWYWTMTPWTCDPEYSYYVRCVHSSGALDHDIAYGGYRGVRPLCYLKSEILVSVPGEENETPPANCPEAVQDARDDLLNALNDYPVEIWGDALGATVSALFKSKQDADAIAAENETAAEG